MSARPWPHSGEREAPRLPPHVLRLVRRAGPAAVRRHRPGTDDGFAALCRLTGLDGASTP
ncbi:unnamed protein product [[Actinomadura] parvosata subsp. kistnae]|uniref:Uncharacterized protein n=1 Tax=[Actinomadura] parvosata subsp. kistnae TaxID=1909395 RepID=A0A1U9ZVQ4_9ACTN|nr:hypothetical protein [Nonomuraea sp. ATCC 55076]AQZ62035.1 hypothetical protein BKM31_11625 [Nonomuraea sp. ATCC 55076]SPL89368.1 unnamed protein product [Actinomadura parvosata subsp. kistnae]